ncbi:AAA family ATPase [Spiroplasma culicicola]|uniref:ABC transporter ATP-binding protein n=1 Tax=Spiroplasma culicicola AES-1 TaxID=1276246 RepID=W6A7N3_9MOLU|nr:AAA family ATPase [Spiroplasma culicicola]AHI52997.1 ABC transporter ATP-binding protein [Spiroplasma culicicola AES-1]
MGTIKPSSGSIQIEIENLRKNAVFQLTSYGNESHILDIAKMYFDLFHSQLDLNQLFSQFELDDQKKKKFNKMSGGQQQKFKFLIALLNNPNLLLLDELTTSLDFVWRSKIIGLLKNAIEKSEATVILVSHDKEEIAHLCDRVIYIENGKITKDIMLPKKFKEKVILIESELMNYEAIV